MKFHYVVGKVCLIALGLAPLSADQAAAQRVQPALGASAEWTGVVSTPDRRRAVDHQLDRTIGRSETLRGLQEPDADGGPSLLEFVGYGAAIGSVAGAVWLGTQYLAADASDFDDGIHPYWGIAFPIAATATAGGLLGFVLYLGQD